MIYTVVININPNIAVDFESKKIEILILKLMKIKKLFLENNLVIYKHLWMKSR